MSAFRITTARNSCPTMIHIIMRANSFAYFVLSGAAFATGISNRARRRERPTAYSNGISLGSFNHWHYSNPDNCHCSGHRRLPRVYYEYNEPRSTWAASCSLKGEQDHLKSRKNPRSDRYHFFRASRPGPYPIDTRPRIFHFEMDLWTAYSRRFAWWISSEDRGWKIDGKAPRWNSRSFGVYTDYKMIIYRVLDL